MRSVFRSKALAGMAGGDALEHDPRPFVLQILGWSSRDAAAFVVGALATVAILTNVLFLQSGPHPAPMLKTGLIPVPPPAARQTAVGTLPAPRPSASSQAKPTASKPEAQPAPATGPRSSTDITSDIQRELARRGFYDESVDGRLGPKTEAAIRNFERASGLKPSTEPNEALLRAITRSNAKGPKPAGKAAPLALRPPAPIPVPPPPSPPRNDAEVIAPSKRVLAVQRALADYGYGQIKPTGVVDGQTQAAIQKFERERKLPVTGQVNDRIAQELAAITGRAME